jgi:hypothetical protein
LTPICAGSSVLARRQSIAALVYFRRFSTILAVRIGPASSTPGPWRSEPAVSTGTEGATQTAEPGADSTSARNDSAASARRTHRESAHGGHNSAIIIPRCARHWPGPGRTGRASQPGQIGPAGGRPTPTPGPTFSIMVGGSPVSVTARAPLPKRARSSVAQCCHGPTVPGPQLTEIPEKKHKS